MATITDRVAALTLQRRPFVHATVVRAQEPTSARPGDAAVILEDGSIEGFVGGQCATSTVRTAALDTLRDGRTLLLRVLPESSAEFPEAPGALVVVNPCHSGGAIEIFLRPVLPAPILLVTGDTPIARAVSSLATFLEWEVTPASPPPPTSVPPISGPHLAGPGPSGPHVSGSSHFSAHFAGLSSSGLHVAAPSAFGSDGVGLDGVGLDGAGAGEVGAGVAGAGPIAAVVAGLGDGDGEAVRAALDAGVGFVALVASRRRGAVVLDGLGLTGAERARIHTPAGLDIGARTPQEIALSIMGEVVRAVRADGLAAPAAAVLPGPRTEVDPVCGMTVVVGPGAVVAGDHYFCGTGCRDAFLARA
ncbi:hypothetical protein GCM10010435_81050 [Winogradskya consettensis]|uniref:Xanthine dehydrogenase accessory factor n=1 Tax=Winogradskya consettensis TaxID=113560 RepID=A0A919VSG5_9ACTN|nr:XdhC family protein [Actinoplanes consettensis]GIM77154.1 hypothetical protein Aco04nite_53930 [Actinoplanes consettensis]